MRVGVVGLGTMGGEMVRALLGAGHEVIVHDASKEAVERAVDAGARDAGSSAEVGSGSQIALLSLPMPEHVVEVVAGEYGLLSSPADGLVVVDTSTVDPDTTRRMAAEAVKAGVGYLDAPILGRPDACGRWTMPVGGDAGTLERARPALEALGGVTHVGGSGSGNAIKLLNNLMFGAINAVTAEVFAAAERVGVSPERFYETVAASDAATVSNLFRALGPKILERDFSPTFAMGLLDKDNRLAVEMMERAGAPAMVGDAVKSLNARARAAGHGAEDTSALVKVYEALLREV